MEFILALAIEFCPDNMHSPASEKSTLTVEVIEVIFCKQAKTWTCH